jgi:sugar phosphate isomerase/epimerase
MSEDILEKTVIASTAVFLDRSLLDALKLIHDAGFKAVELWADPPHAWPRHVIDEEDKIKRVVEELGLRVYSVCPHFAPWGGLNIAHYNDGIRRESVVQLKESIEMAHAFGAELVLAVPGWVYCPQIFPIEKARRYAVESLRECASLAKNYDIRIGLENTLTFVDPSDILAIIEEVGASNVGSYVDVSNALRSGFAPAEYIRKLGRTIFAVHLSDANSRNDHLPIGKGDIDFSQVIKALKDVDYAGNIIFEMFNVVSTELSQSRKTIEALIKSIYS